MEGRREGGREVVNESTVDGSLGQRKNKGSPLLELPLPMLFRNTSMA